MKIMIASPCFGGNVTTDYCGSLLNTLRACQAERIEAAVYFIKNESLISRARNNCASNFLRSDCDKLFFIDADQAWSPDDFLTLVKSEKTLIGGTYPKKTLPLDLNFTPLPEHDAPGAIRNLEWFREYAKRGAEVPVRHLATGFMCISRKVFEDLKAGDLPSYLAKDNQHAEEFRHWDFFPAGVIGGGYESEDFFFCSQATAAGHQPHLATSVIVDHLGQLNYSVRSLK